MKINRTVTRTKTKKIIKPSVGIKSIEKLLFYLQLGRGRLLVIIRLQLTP